MVTTIVIIVPEGRSSILNSTTGAVSLFGKDGPEIGATASRIHSSELLFLRLDSSKLLSLLSGDASLRRPPWLHYHRDPHRFGGDDGILFDSAVAAAFSSPAAQTCRLPG